MRKEELFCKFQPFDHEEILYFWGHSPRGDGSHDKSCLSQWYKCEFVSHGGERFYSAEQYMMYAKALLFNDLEVAQKIINQVDPRVVKALGRQIRGFQENVWDLHKLDVVIRANELKFSQNAELLEFLVSTKFQFLVEASPYDKIWGIGMIEAAAKRVDPSRWLGENLLGFCLMEVRERLLSRRISELHDFVLKKEN